MHQKKLIFNFIIVYLIIFIVIFKSFCHKEIAYKNIFKNAFDYKEKYEEIISDYGLISDLYDFLPAQVININNKKINEFILINKGYKDGIKENSFVVNSKGLVGEVEKVYKRYSVVRLITSKSVSVAVEINNCYGSLNKYKNKYIINDLINCDNVQKNDSVYTSKYNYSSSNILIGKVKRIDRGKIYIDYNFNPYELRYLGVINDNI